MLTLVVAALTAASRGEVLIVGTLHPAPTRTVKS